MKIGDKVTVNGVHGFIINEYEQNTYEVRVFMGGRHVGDIVVPEDRLQVIE